MASLAAITNMYAGQYYKPIQNRLGFWVEAGANSWLMQKSELKNSVGAGMGVGFAYEMQREHFILNIGVGANALYNPVKLENTACTLYNQDDLDPLYGGGAGEKLDYMYYMTDRKDHYVNMSIQVPILLGYTSDRFFFLAGAKFGYMLNLQTYCKTTIDTKGYNSVIGTMENMPMYQFYTGREKEDKMRCSLKPDVALSVELGSYLGDVIKGTGYNRFRKKQHYRLSVFADYGLTQINHQSLIEPVVTPERYVAPSTYDMVDAASLHDVVSSSVAGKVNNLFVGIKFTALFDLPEPRECVMCKSDLKFVPKVSQSGKRRTLADEKPGQRRR
ncbi:MAG: hypothetical protein MJZ65_01000 [Paludibacteraceae bacterium]|nr:hypothetical protein [Paludibacteraceae bacterium]